MSTGRIKSEFEGCARQHIGRGEIRAVVERGIQRERDRQIQHERYTPEHDTEHSDGSLADAAACYAAGRHIYQDHRFVRYASTELWPWERESDKRGKHDRLDELAKAGALIQAEMERLVWEMLPESAAESPDA